MGYSPLPEARRPWRRLLRQNEPMLARFETPTQVRWITSTHAGSRLLIGIAVAFHLRAFLD